MKNIYLIPGILLLGIAGYTYNKRSGLEKSGWKGESPTGTDVIVEGVAGIGLIYLGIK